MSEETTSLISSVSELSEFEKGQIVGAYLGGLSMKDVSQMCNVSSQTVAEVLSLYKLFLDVTPAAIKRNATPAVKKKKNSGTTAVNKRKSLKVSETHNGNTEETSVTENKETEDGAEEPSEENTATQVDQTGNKPQSSNKKGNIQTATKDGK